jgi:hypothetical protein
LKGQALIDGAFLRLPAALLIPREAKGQQVTLKKAISDLDNAS